MAALPFVQGERVLELAHGTGHLLLALHGQGYSTVGADLSPAMGRIAQQRLQQTVPLVRTRAQALAFAPNSFATIVTTFPTEFILQPATLRSIRQTLKPNGRLVIVPAAHLLGGSRIERAIEWLFAVTGQKADAEVAEVAFWDGWVEKLEEGGFSAEIHPIDLKTSRVLVIVATAH